MATLTVYSDLDDGRIRSQDLGLAANYPDARAGIGNGGLAVITAGVAATIGQRKNGLDYELYQGFFRFDTSDLTAAAVVSDAVFSTELSSETSDTDYVEHIRLENWVTALDTSDYIAGANLSSKTLLATYDTTTTRSAGTRYDFTSDAAFKDNVSLIGDTAFLMTTDHAVDNVAPTGNEYVNHKMADTAGTTSDPKLVVTYELGGSSIGNSHQMML